MKLKNVFIFILILAISITTLSCGSKDVTSELLVDGILENMADVKSSQSSIEIELKAPINEASGGLIPEGIIKLGIISETNSEKMEYNSKFNVSIGSFSYNLSMFGNSERLHVSNPLGSGYYYLDIQEILNDKELIDVFGLDEDTIIKFNKALSGESLEMQSELKGIYKFLKKEALLSNFLTLDKLEEVKFEADNKEISGYHVSATINSKNIKPFVKKTLEYIKTDRDLIQFIIDNLDTNAMSVDEAINEINNSLKEIDKEDNGFDEFILEFEKLIKDLEIEFYFDKDKNLRNLKIEYKYIQDLGFENDEINIKIDFKINKLNDIKNVKMPDIENDELYNLIDLIK